MQVTGGPEIGGRNFSRGIYATPITLDLAAGKITPYGLPYLSKLYRKG
jgi:hypothetical protein